jgi:hypothetical protein
VFSKNTPGVFKFKIYHMRLCFAILLLLRIDLPISVLKFINFVKVDTCIEIYWICKILYSLVKNFVFFYNLNVRGSFPIVFKFSFLYIPFIIFNSTNSHLKPTNRLFNPWKINRWTRIPFTETMAHPSIPVLNPTININPNIQSLQKINSLKRL